MVGATVIGRFEIDHRGQITLEIDTPLEIRLTNRSLLKIDVTDDPETVIQKVSSHGLCLGLDFASEYAVGDIGKGARPQWVDSKA